MTNRIQRSVQKLQAALRRLTPEDGARARRNRRGRALAALRSVREALDEAYPPIRPPSAPRAKRVSAMNVPQGRKDRIAERRLYAAGYLPAPTSSGLYHAAAVAGVRFRRAPRGAEGIALTWVPAWVHDVYAVTTARGMPLDRAPSREIHRFARMTPRERRARLAELALERSTPTEAGQ